MPLSRPAGLRTEALHHPVTLNGGINWLLQSEAALTQIKSFLTAFTARRVGQILLH